MKSFDLEEFSGRLIKIIRDEFNITPHKFAKECKIPITTLDTYLPLNEKRPKKRLSQPGADAIVKMAIFTQKTTDMILLGEDYSNLTTEEKKIIDLWRDKKYRKIRKMIIEAEERQELTKQEEAVQASEKTSSKKSRAGL